MARYTGPKVRVSRRLGTNIFENEKGRKALERRPFPPGAHGRTRRRNAGSEYLAQLQEKQKAKYIYGVLERQFRNTYEEAVRLQARPVRTCCACSSSASTTSSTAPAGQAPARRPASSSATASSTSTASASTSPATASARARSSASRRRPAT